MVNAVQILQRGSPKKATYLLLYYSDFTQEWDTGSLEEGDGASKKLVH